MSRDFHLITRQRPSALAFARAVAEAAGRELDIAGDFEDPDDYLNISDGDGLWIEVEPPGHVERDDLLPHYPAEFIVLPDPDDEGCLWFTVASVPAGAPSSGADVIEEAFKRLARACEGIAIQPP
ncbi:MAG: hypothetical protein J2P25_18490 [Nocardiopsaceae bacterium]|nr:hypothetical protein [Nocardiopsaceae bacterium]MBO0805050.1 hypothetical protein [Nocardiopsaceae bacterium]